MTRRRPAISLIEALMAIFVTAIGLLALLTLFPLGAVQMAQSLKDQRTAEAASNGTSVFKSFNVGNDPAAIADPAQPVAGLTLFEQLPPYNPPAVPPLGAVPSYPVYVDPQGAQAGMGMVVGGTSGIPRTPFPGAVTTKPALVNPRWTTLLDDLTYDNAGNAENLGTPLVPVVQREGRYTWAWMIRRPSANDSTPLDPVDLTVVVYSGRPLGSGETTYTANFGLTGANPPAVNANVVTVSWAPGQDRPSLRRGGWILDARLVPAPQGYFYRVTSITEVPALPGMAGTLELEVQRPLGGQLRNPGFPGLLVVMDNVSEVFEKGTNY